MLLWVIKFKREKVWPPFCCSLNRYLLFFNSSVRTVVQETKLCPKCEQHLPYDQFHKHKGKGLLGLKSWCKTCDNAKMKELRETDPEWRKNRNKATSRYYYENAEEQRRKASIRDNSPEGKRKRAERSYKRKYGMTLAQVEHLKQLQNNLCAICNTEFTQGWDERGQCVDHDHKTGKVRGLLCRRCNLGIGQLGDSHEILIAAAEYLKRHQE